MNNLIINNHIISEPLINILNEVKSESNSNILDTIEDKGDYIRITCPFHANGQEHRASCSVYIGDGDVKYGTFHCFTCGSKGSFQELIGHCLGSNKFQGEKWLIDKYSNSYIKPRFDLEDIVLHKDKAVKIIDDSILAGFESYHPYMKKRKLADNVIKDFNIKYDPKYKAIVFPVRDKNGRIIALTRRSVEGKQFYIDKDFDKSNLYAIDKIKDCNTVILVESQINCLSLWGWGKPSLATFGCGCPDSQISMLNSLPVLHYIIAFDNDEAGKKGTLRLCDKLSKTKLVDVVIFNDNRDVNDLTKEEFESLSVIDRHQYMYNK